MFATVKSTRGTCSLILALACGLFMAGCRTHPRAIAVIPRTTATILWEPLHQGVAETANSTGFSVYWNAPQNEAYSEQQMQMYASLQTRSFQGFILSPDETLAARTAVLETMHRGVPVVIVNDELGPPSSQLLSYVRSDETIGARLASHELARLLHGQGNIAISGIIPRSEASLTREEEFEKAIAAISPGIHIVLRRFGDTVLTHQQQIAQEVMQQPERIDAIVALSATATRGAYYAKLANPPTHPVAVIGFDQDLILPVRTGEINAIIAQDTRTIGQIAMRNLQAQIKGESVPGVTLVPPVLIRREEVNSPAMRRLLAFTSFPWKNSWGQP